MEINRRGLFRTAGAAAALTGLAACSAESEPASPATTAAPATSEPAPPPAKSPAATLTGRIVRPADPEYAEASAGWDLLFTHYPMVIVFAQKTEDVVNALTWARQNDVALRVRSGRHCLEGWSSVDNGIVIDVSELKSATVDAAAKTATVGAGLNQMEAVTELGKAGFAAPTGTEGTVGLVGATLGGGFGLLTRNLGMAADNLLAAEIVVPTGADGATALTADESENTDLLWALRGAGNGNFGIVTSMTYRIHPLTQTIYVNATCPEWPTWRRCSAHGRPRRLPPTTDSPASWKCTPTAYCWSPRSYPEPRTRRSGCWRPSWASERPP